MEILLVIAVTVVVGALIYFNRSSRGLDANQDGKVDLNDANTFIDNTVSGIKNVLDVNRDGSVDTKDLAAVGEAAKSTVKKAAESVKSGVRKVTDKKTTTKKPAAKKSASKKPAAKK